jgi:alpha-tubulin suppressor-like RCC1 family protein
MAERKRKSEQQGSMNLNYLSPTTSTQVGQRKKLHGSKNNIVTRQRPLNEEFLSLKKSFWQQGMEALNETTRQCLAQEGAEAETENYRFLTACEAVRMQTELENLYHRPVGSVVAMGQDDTAQLGISSSPDEEKETSYPPTLCRSIPNNVCMVAVGGLHSIALTDDGFVYSWGCNDDGALGRVTDGDGDGDLAELEQSTPTVITEGFEKDDQGSIVNVECGDSHTMYLSVTGNVYMSGIYKDMDSGKFRDVPQGSTECKAVNMVPVKVTKLSKLGRVRKVACGASFNAAILEDDSLVTWGTCSFTVTFTY